MTRHASCVARSINTRRPDLTRSDRHDGDRLREIATAAAAFFQDIYWGPDNHRVTRLFLSRRDLSETTLRRFSVGYAPIGWMTLSDHLHNLGFGIDEIIAAGLATQSHRRDDRYYDLFRSRLMFPLLDDHGRITGFAGRATHPGPSWPRWVISPGSPIFRGQRAIFGFEQAAPAIRREAGAVVLRDCLGVLERSQAGERATVAVIRSRVTPEHVARLEACGMKVRRDGERRLTLRERMNAGADSPLLGH